MMPNPLTQAQRQALLDLKDALPDIRVVLIGASALACQLDMHWRKTNDLDLTVVAEESALAERLRGLLWTRHGYYEHRWSTALGVVVDALPVTTERIADGRLVFPGSQHVMSLVGFDLVLKHCNTLALAEETTLDVATVPVLVVLKMASWLDRPAERERDLHDIAHVFDTYLEADDLRRWDDPLIEAGLSYENQSAFALGQDIARIIAPSHQAVIDTFLRAISDEATSKHALFAACFDKTAGTMAGKARLSAFGSGLGELADGGSTET